jgi:hypothetical protein
LAIRLRMIGQTVNQVSPEGRVQLLPKASDKLSPSIKNDHLRNSLQT